MDGLRFFVYSGGYSFEKLSLPDARVGDYLVFHNIGAYSVTEGIYLFLSRRMPKIWLYSEAEGACLQRDGLETWKVNTWSENKEEVSGWKR